MYALRRLLYLPLSLFLLSLVCFALRQLAPGDAVQNQLPDADSRLLTDDPAAYDALYQRTAAAYGYNLPVFYFTIRNGAMPDTLHRVVRPEEREMLRSLTLASGNWAEVQEYYRALRGLAYPLPPRTVSVAMTATARRLLLQDDPETIRRRVFALDNSGPAKPLIHHLTQAFRLPRSALLGMNFSWHGTSNQYHRWLTGYLRGDFGRSNGDRRPVVDKVAPALRWTALLNGLAIFLVYLVSIPLGLYLADKPGSRTDQVVTFLLFLLFGLPSFWIATLLTNFFTTPAFGMDFFPSMGFGDVPMNASWWETFRIRTGHLFLPVLCLAYPSFAYVTRHLRRSAKHELQQAYVKTARLKGLSVRQIRWRHVFRNASFPIITMLGSLLPALLVGSVLIERIFNLPGMGQLLYNAALGSDWPVVIALVMLNGVLTAVGLLLADLTYAYADPRVRLGRTTTSGR
ncbi:MAG: ABC transporter permease [Bacteroidota bacterium]